MGFFIISQIYFLLHFLNQFLSFSFLVIYYVYFRYSYLFFIPFIFIFNNTNDRNRDPRGFLKLNSSLFKTIYIKKNNTDLIVYFKALPENKTLEFLCTNFSGKCWTCKRRPAERRSEKSNLCLKMLSFFFFLNIGYVSIIFMLFLCYPFCISTCGFAAFSMIGSATFYLCYIIWLNIFLVEKI